MLTRRAKPIAVPIQ